MVKFKELDYKIVGNNKSMNFILMEISYLKLNKELTFLDSHLDQKLPLESVKVISSNSFFQHHKKMEGLFINNYGQSRLNELKSKLSICYSFELPDQIESDLYKLGKSVIKNHDDKLKQEIDKLYNLFFMRQYKNIITLSTAIWLVKDSCVQENNTYFFTKSGYQNHTRIEMPYTLANGEHKTISLTDGELTEVEKNYFLLYSIMARPLSTAPLTVHHTERASTIENDKLDRSKESSFVRALISLQNARRSGQLTVKIDFYMQVLQCIYGLEGMKSAKIEKTLQNITSNLLNLNPEDSQQLTQALSISNNFSSEKGKKGLLDTIKMAFRIRSKQSHGNKVTYSAREIEKTVILVDEYVRKVLQIVLPDGNLDYSTKEEAKKVFDYFNCFNK